MERTSPKLTELETKQSDLKAKAKACQAEDIRIGRLLNPAGWHTSTVIRMTDVDAAVGAFIGIRPQRDRPTIVVTGTDGNEDTARAETLKRTLAGETIENNSSLEEQRVQNRRRWAACEDAIEFLSREIERERNRLAEEYAKEFKVTHDKQMAAVYMAALALHAAWSEAYEGKRHLIDSGIGLRIGPYHNTPEPFLGTPNNPHSPLAAMFVEAEKQGLIDEVPESLQLPRPAAAPASPRGVFNRIAKAVSR